MKNVKEITAMIDTRITEQQSIQIEILRIEKPSEKGDFIIGDIQQAKNKEIAHLFKNGTMKAHRRVSQLTREIDLLKDVLY